MKVNLSLLIILLMASACWCSSCYWADWWKSFDHAGWSRCRSKEYVTGFYRSSWTPHDPIYLLEEARCCQAPTPYQNTSSTCVRKLWRELDGLVLKSKIHLTNAIEKNSCCSHFKWRPLASYDYDQLFLLFLMWSFKWNCWKQSNEHSSLKQISVIIYEQC